MSDDIKAEALRLMLLSIGLLGRDSSTAAVTLAAVLTVQAARFVEADQHKDPEQQARRVLADAAASVDLYYRGSELITLRDLKDLNRKVNTPRRLLARYLPST